MGSIRSSDSSCKPSRLTGKPVSLVNFAGYKLSKVGLVRGELVVSMSRMRIRLNSCNRRVGLARVIPFLVFAVSAIGLPAQTAWTVVGPDGGDARSFAAVPGHPNHLYLGTTGSRIYESTDRGANWRRLAKLDATDDLVLDNIVVDESAPSTIYAAAWQIDRPGGGLWISHDGGQSWKISEAIDICACPGALKSAHALRGHPPGRLSLYRLRQFLDINQPREQ
jgi:hypothetical protein